MPGVWRHLSTRIGRSCISPIGDGATATIAAPIPRLPPRMRTVLPVKRPPRDSLICYVSCIYKLFFSLSTGFVMVTKKQSRVPGRPRRFAPEQAISAAKVLFHQKGFDAVSVAEVTDYLGINPPSLYAAFGSKLGYLSRQYSVNAASVRKLFRLPIFFVMIVQ